MGDYGKENHVVGKFSRNDKRTRKNQQDGAKRSDFISVYSLEGAGRGELMWVRNDKSFLVPTADSGSDESGALIAC